VGPIGIDGGGANDALADTSASDTGTTDTGSDVVVSDPCLAENKPQVALVTVEEGDSVTLDCTKDWILDKPTFVRAGATLTIQPGTTIKATRGLPEVYSTTGMLIVQRGGKLIADGLRDKPIVFTSVKAPADRRPADWGGVVLLGKATVNQPGAKLEGVPSNIPAEDSVEYGGNDDADNSGVLRYVRIEYAGFTIAKDREINGLTFGGVGSGTVVDFVQVRLATDDCFEFFGGTVNAKHLICHYNQDDGFDWDFGYRGKLQYLILQQDPNFYDDQNGFEGDNASASPAWNLTPFSSPSIANVTLCGPGKPTVRPVDDAGTPVTLRRRYGMLVRRRSGVKVLNSIVLGFEGGFNFGGAGADTIPGDLDRIEVRNTIFFGNIHAPGAAAGIGNVAFPEVTGGAQFLANDDSSLDEFARLTDVQFNNVQSDPGIGCGVTNVTNPSFAPSGKLTVPAIDVPGLDKTDYMGALRDTNDTWATGKWVVWSDK
jgi:hypothetical protein